jgi:hypothetical protein
MGLLDLLDASCISMAKDFLLIFLRFSVTSEILWDTLPTRTVKEVLYQIRSARYSPHQLQANDTNFLHLCWVFFTEKFYTKFGMM